MSEATTKKLTSDSVTQGIRIQAEAFFLNSGKNGYQDIHTFSYKITMSNEGPTPAQLISRHWVIIDSSGVREEVKGPGVVGATPRLEVNDTPFSYTSYSQINTEWGTMEGTYLFKRNDGEQFDVKIGRFYLVKN